VSAKKTPLPTEVRPTMKPPKNPIAQGDDTVAVREVLELLACPWPHEALRDESDPADKESDSEHLASERLDLAAVVALDPGGEGHAGERHRGAAEEHRAREPRLDVSKGALAHRSDGFEDGAVEDVRADRVGRAEAEAEHEHGCHQRPAAHTGQPDERADQEPGEGELPGHRRSGPAWPVPSRP
jgi:hypothetical protein